MQQVSSSKNYHGQNGYYNRQQEQEQEQVGLFTTIQKMIFYLKQEQLASTLLGFKEQLFEKIRKNLKEQEQNLKEYKKKEDDPDTSNSQKNYKTIIYSMQIQKISFILKHYLKIRLDKIKKCSFYYFKNMADAEPLMSKSQMQFLKKYVELRYKYYQKNVFKFLAKNFKGVGGMQLFLGRPQQIKLVNSNQSLSNVVQPDIGSYVFVKMNRNPNEFRYKRDMQVNDVPAEESQIASTNDILFVPFSLAKSLMGRSQEGDLVLM